MYLMYLTRGYGGSYNKKLGNTALTDKQIPVQSKTSGNRIQAMQLNEIQASL